MTVGPPYWVEVLAKGGREITWTTLPDKQVGYFCLPGLIPVGRYIPITPVTDTVTDTDTVTVTEVTGTVTGTDTDTDTDTVTVTVTAVPSFCHVDIFIQASGGLLLKIRLP